MLRSWLWLASWVTSLLLVPVLLIRAQPYDHQAMRALLSPPQNCPAPCFIGIRPGQTRAEDALAILQAHSWVVDVREVFGSMKPEVIDYQLPPVLSMINWQWHESSSYWINDERHGSMVLIDRQVDAINLHTRLPLGDVLLTYGPPDVMRLLWSSQQQFQYDSWYADYCMRVTADGVEHPRRLYQQAVNIVFQKQRPDVYEASIADLTCGL